MMQKSASWLRSGVHGSFLCLLFMLPILVARAQDRPAPPPDPNDPTAVQFRDLIKQGQTLNRTRQFEGAAELFRQAIALRPQASEAHVYLSQALLNLQRNNEALEEAKRALELDPKNAAAQLGFGNVNRAFQRLGEALEAYQQAVKLNPDYLNAWLSLGTLLSQQKRYAESGEAFQQALRLNPNHQDALNGEGIAQFRTGHTEEGLTLVRKAVEVAPNFANAWMNLGYWNAELGRYAESVEAFGQVIRITPRFPTAYRYRALNQLYLGRGEATAKDVREWLTLTNWDRNDVHFMILFGVLGYRMAGQADAAESLLAEAVKRVDAAAWPYPVLRYLKREIPAATVLELANTNDRLTEAHAYLGMDLSLSGKRAEALEHLRWIKEHGNRNFIEYPLALTEIARLEKATVNPSH